MSRIIIVFCLWFSASVAFADDAEESLTDDGFDTSNNSQYLKETVELELRYRNREEEREAGLKHQLMDWLVLSSLLEMEVIRSDYEFDETDNNDKSLEDNFTFQLGMLGEYSDAASFELVFEYDSDENEILTEEALLVFEKDPWEFTLGKQYTPFGTYCRRHLKTAPICRSLVSQEFLPGQHS